MKKAAAPGAAGQDKGSEARLTEKQFLKSLPRCYAGNKEDVCDCYFRGRCLKPRQKGKRGERCTGLEDIMNHINEQNNEDQDNDCQVAGH